VALADHDLFHLAMGYPFVRVAGQEREHFESNVADWKVAWWRHREAVLAWWLSSHAGSRPPAWWLFEQHQSEPDGDDDDDEPSEVELLYELGELTDDEIEAIRDQALAHIEFNRNRHPDQSATNFVPDHGGIVEFVTSHELLIPEECPEYF
jgi:hypothetical protein